MTNNGLVGFFDILGYQNIVDNNEINTVSQIVSETLLKMPETAKKKLSEMLSQSSAMRDHVDVANEIIDKYIKIRLISDSILISVDVEHDGSNTEKAVLLVFVVYSSVFVAEMFDVGLPVRGGIDYGEYYLDNLCFAGKPIINSYRMAEGLDLSAVVLSDYAAEHVQGKVDAKSWDSLFIKYLIPFKEGERLMYILNWYGWGLRYKKKEDISQMVYESFSGHNKDIGNKVHKKLINTEMSIRAMLVHGKKNASNK